MPLHVLVISDNASYADFLCGVMAAEGYRASPVAEGKGSLAAIRLNGPDLLVVAVEAAKIHDWAAQYRLHTPDGPRNVPVIVISDSPSLEPELLQVYDFIPQPIDVPRLLADLAALAAARHKGRRHSTLTDQEHLELSRHLLACTGLDFQAHHRSALTRGVGKRMSTLHLEHGRHYLAYLQRHGESRHELQKLLQYLTVGETAFFRYPCHFEALKERLRALAPSRPIRIWSAGCSTGEEPYSIAISVMQALPDWRERDIKIFATDINGKSVKAARQGAYTPWAFRMTDQRRLKGYFLREGKSALLRDEVKRLVEFRTGTLFPAEESGPGEELRELDAIFCRNVLIYFSEHASLRTLGLLAASLKPSGQLFLGHAEPLSPGLPSLKIAQHGKSAFYVRTEEAIPPAGAWRQSPLPSSSGVPLPPAAARPAKEEST